MGFVDLLIIFCSVGSVGGMCFFVFEVEVGGCCSFIYV